MKTNNYVKGALGWKFGEGDLTHPIVTVQISPYISAQGPTVDEADPRRGSLPTDVHGNLSVRTGPNTIAVGRPTQRTKK